MPNGISRRVDTELIMEVEYDFTIHGDQVKFGGGAVVTRISNALIRVGWGIGTADNPIHFLCPQQMETAQTSQCHHPAGRRRWMATTAGGRCCSKAC